MSESIHRKSLSHSGYSNRRKKIAYTFYNFNCKKSYFGTCVGIWKCWILPGPIKALNSIRFQMTSWASPELQGLRFRYLRKISAVHPPETCDCPAWTMRLLKRKQILFWRASKRRIFQFLSAPRQLKRTMLCCALFPCMRIQSTAQWLSLPGGQSGFEAASSLSSLRFFWISSMPWRDIFKTIFFFLVIFPGPAKSLP